MNQFSIKDIEMLSGIKAHTLRIWEQRHGLYFCKRKESHHRYYDNEDLKAVLRISFLYHRGYKISKIARFTQDEIISLTMSNSLGDNDDAHVRHLIEATMDYDQPRFEKIVKNAIERSGMEKALINIFYPFMQKVGMLWVTGHLIPAQEHFSSSLIQQKLLLATDRLPPVAPQRNETVLIFSPEKEFHEIPLVVARYLFKKAGINTVYFGVNVSIDQLDYYLKRKSITHLYFHLITNLQNKDAIEYVTELANKFPLIKIIASGPILAGQHVPNANITIIDSVEALVPALNR